MANKKAQHTFSFLTGDVNYVDYGGKWIRQVSEYRYHVIELVNMVDACGSDATFTYCVDLSEIDLEEVTDENIKSALSCVGLSLNEAFRYGPLALVEALHSYGCKAPMGDFCGNNWRKHMKEARALSRELDDPSAHAERMNRPVNRIGATAKEYMKGDMRSAVMRGLEEGRTDAQVMFKIYGGEVPDGRS